MPHFSHRLASAALIVTLGACGGETQQQQSADAADTTALNDTSSVYNRAKSIFYSMPSPLEFTTLIKSAGGTFRKELLHNTGLSTQYQGAQKQSLLLGVYGADLSYASVFNQQQDAIKILAASKRLGEKLGIHQAFSADLMERANANLQNQDSMLHIMTEMYWQTNSQLKEENRNEIAVMVMLGGWAEGLYLGAQNLDLSNPDPEIAKRLAEQKFTAEQVQALLDEHQSSELVAPLMPLFQPIINQLRALPLGEVAQSTVSTGADGVAVIGGGADVQFTQADLQALHDQVTSLRQTIVSL